MGIQAGGEAAKVSWMVGSRARDSKPRVEEDLQFNKLWELQRQPKWDVGQGVAGKRELNKSMFNVIFEAASRRKI